MVKLKPCPICGGEAFLWSIGEMTRISCKNECIVMPSRTDVFFSGAADAVEAWNRRANDET